MNIKRHFVTGLAVACLVLGAAVAQNIVKSVQLSQDPTGGAGVDAFGGIFFPNHVNVAQPASPTLSSFGTSPVLTGTDSAGEIVEGTGSVTVGTLTFARAYNATPYCTAQTTSNTTPVGMVPTPNGFSITHIASAASMKIYYQCVGGRTG